MIGYNTAQWNALAADNLSNAIMGAIRMGTVYKPEYKKCMRAKGYYVDIEYLIAELKDDKDSVVRNDAAELLGKMVPHINECTRLGCGSSAMQ